MAETGLFPLLIAGGITLLKEVGILVGAVLVADWLTEGMSDPTTPPVGQESAWLDDVQRQYWADQFGAVLEVRKATLTGPGLASLTASVALARKAILEPDSAAWQGGVLYRALSAKADKLEALQAGNAGSAQVELLPEVEWVGAGMVIDAGDDPAAPAAPIGRASMGGASFGFLGAVAVGLAGWWWWQR